MPQSCDPPALLPTSPGDNKHFLSLALLNGGGGAGVGSPLSILRSVSAGCGLSGVRASSLEF